MMSGPASVALVLLMLVGCLILWVGVPLAWLWIGSQVQGSSSLGTALMVTMIGIIVSIVALVSALGWLNRRHAALAEHPRDALSALEVILVSSAGIAIVGFGIWFFGFPARLPSRSPAARAAPDRGLYRRICALPRRFAEKLASGRVSRPSRRASPTFRRAGATRRGRGGGAGAARPPL